MARIITVGEFELGKANEILSNAGVDILLAVAAKLMSECKISQKAAIGLLGISKTTAWRHWGKVFSPCDVREIHRNHGGRHRQYLSAEEEKMFLEEWRQNAIDGKIVTVAEMKDSYEERAKKNNYRCWFL